MKICGIDPGQTTGVCLIEDHDDSNDFQVLNVWQIPWENRLTFFKALLTCTFTNGESLVPEVVVIESFRLRPGRAMEQVGSEFPSVRIIGIVEALLSLCIPQPPLIFQEPSVTARVNILSDDQPILLGLVHASDAYKHARYYHLRRRMS